MVHDSMKFVVSLTVWTLATPLSPLAWAADNLNSVRFGEQALAYSSGSIQRSTPQDGFVNVITGDNQTTGDRMILGGQDILYLRLVNPGAAAPGDLFTIYKRTHKVFHPTTGQYLGHLVNRLAVVQVTQTDRDLTTVQIVRTYATVSPGDPVMKFVLPIYEGTVGSQPSASDAEGRIVELQSDMGTMNLVAQGNVVYLDRGREDGIKAGDRMDVIRSGGNLPQRVVGEVKILSLEDQTATALITKSTSRILKGDRFRTKTHAPAPAIAPISRSPKRSPDVTLAPAAKSIEPNDTDYRLSLLSPGRSGAPITAVDATSQTAPTNQSMLDPLPVPVTSAQETIPLSVGQGSSEQSSEVPAVPLQ
jgi:chemotaxis protein MotB